MLKRLDSGLYKISNLKEAQEAARLLEERTEAIKEIEDEMEEQYDLKTMKTESNCLHQSISEWMTKKDQKEVQLDEFRWQLIKPVSRVWNADKLRTIIGKAKFLKVVKMEPDPDKIDQLVREGKLNLDDIEDALEEFPKKAYIKRFENSEAKGDAEAEKVKAAMS